MVCLALQSRFVSLVDDGRITYAWIAGIGSDIEYAMLPKCNSDSVSKNAIVADILGILNVTMCGPGFEDKVAL